MKRIFIVGCYRSGTTLLQTLLSSHPNMVSFPETHTLQSGAGKVSNFYSRVIGFKKICSLLNVSEKIALMAYLKIGLSKKFFARKFIDLLDAKAIERRKEGWIEKSPENLFYADLIEAVVCDVYFVHIVRNGSDVVASLVDLRNKVGEHTSLPNRILFFAKVMLSVFRCAVNSLYTDRAFFYLDALSHRDYIAASYSWLKAVKETERLSNRSNHCVCTYESLVVDPERSLRQICEVIGLEYKDDMLIDYKNEAAKLIRPHETWKKNNFKAIHFTPSKYEKLNAATKAVIGFCLKDHR